AADRLAAGGGVVPELRRDGLRLAGRLGRREPAAHAGRRRGPRVRDGPGRLGRPFGRPFRPRLRGRHAGADAALRRPLQPRLRSAEKNCMRRLLFIAAVLGALAVTAISFAAGSPPAVVPASQTRLPAVPLTLVVPDLRNEAFVFAKEQLQDAGFAWTVKGGVAGYPANIGVGQSPAPGTKLADTGSPLITVTLERNKQYGQTGEPENASPYSPTATKPAG